MQKSDFDVIYLNFWSNIPVWGQNEAISFFLSEDIFLKIVWMDCGSIKNLLKCLEVFLLSLFKGVNIKTYLGIAISLRSFGPFNPFCPGGGGGEHRALE